MAEPGFQARQSDYRAHTVKLYSIASSSGAAGWRNHGERVVTERSKITHKEGEKEGRKSLTKKPSPGG